MKFQKITILIDTKLHWLDWLQPPWFK